MERIRKVSERVMGSKHKDGAGVHLTRVLGWHEVERFDPFLMLDFFDSINPKDYVAGFPWHPHRGIETVTFLAEGCIEHGDSLGNAGTINSGDCQWMTAGSGIIHQEMPKPSPRMFGVQLWINLPAAKKMTTPEYRDLRREDIPVVASTSGDGSVRIIAGTYAGTKGPSDHIGINTQMLEIRLPAEAVFQLDTPTGSTVFAFLQEGTAFFEGSSGKCDKPPLAVLYGDGEKVVLHAGGEGALLLLLTGDPLHEPIAWRGPIVMNTEEELSNAFAELQEGTFIRKSALK